MDWSRAKSILIAVFLTLNIILLSYISINKFGGDPGEVAADTLEILRSKNVAVACEIPLYESDTPRLVYEDGKYDRLKVAHALMGDMPASAEEIGNSEELVFSGKKLSFEGENSFSFADRQPADVIDILDSGKTERYLREMFEKMGFKESAYVLDGYFENTGGGVVFVFTEKYGGYLVFDNCITVLATQKGIAEMKYRHRGIKGFSQEMIKILPAYKILLKNFAGAGEKVAITGIDLGFKGLAVKPGMREYSEGPAWRIRFGEGKSPRYFKASDGGEIRMDEPAVN